MVPLKIPLGQRFAGLPARASGAPLLLDDVLDARFHGGSHIGVLIDLCSHDPHTGICPATFDAEKEVRSRSVAYVNIAAETKDSAKPNDDLVRLFVNIVRRQRENGYEVGVFCSNGHDTTGYMIVSLLIEDGYSPEAALNAFAAMRPPGILSYELRHALCLKHDAMDALGPPPAVAHLSAGAALALHHHAAASAAAAPIAPPPAAPGTYPAMQKVLYAGPPIETPEQFVAGLGAPLTLGAELAELRRMTRELCGLPPADAGREAFPGNQAISLDRRNMEMLKTREFSVSWKADGARYMLLVLSDGVHLIDRNFEFTRVPALYFPSKPHSPVMCDATLLDGELVLDAELKPDGKRGTGIEVRYYVFDVVSIAGRRPPENHKARLLAMSKSLLEPRKGDTSRDYSSQTFNVRMKEFWSLRESVRGTPSIVYILRSVLPALQHENDGLIMQPMDAQYEVGQSKCVLKWKPPELNTIDVLCYVVVRSMSGTTTPWHPGTPGVSQSQLVAELRSHDGDMLVPEETIVFDTMEEYAKYNGKIVECARKGNGWVVHRVRPDKLKPNSTSTVQNVLRSINDNILADELVTIVAAAKSAHSQAHPQAQAQAHQ